MGLNTVLKVISIITSRAKTKGKHEDVMMLSGRGRDRDGESHRKFQYYKQTFLLDVKTDAASRGHYYRRLV